MNCPYCNSTDTDFLEKKNKWLCNNCDKAFAVKQNSELTTNPLRIFVSYGHDEYSPFAKELNRSLQKRGHKTFLDGEWLKEGKDWELQLEKGLEFIAEDPENGRILLIVTPYSVRRNEEPMGYCLNEIAKALDKRMTIIPVMLVWAEMPLSIYRLQYLDLSKSPDEKNITSNFESDFAQIYRVVETKDLLDSTGSMSSLKSALDPLDFTADLTYYQPWFTGRQWVFADIQKWLNDENASRMFWVTGVPGIGKTTIATKLQLLKNVVAFHLCRRGHSEKASPKRIVCSLAYQLSTQIKSYREILSTIPVKEEVERANATALFDMLIVQPLHKVASPYGYPLVILIDGLDEASHDGQNEVAQFLAAEFDKLPKWLRIILTSRPEQEIITPLQSKFEPWILDPESAQNEQDIIDYLEKRLEKYSDREDFSKIITTLSANASGVFQYAKCICDEIKEERYDLNNLKQLPNNLAGIYQQYFADKFKSEDYYTEKIRPALEVLIAAFDPITKEELKLFLGWDDYAVRKFLKDIGSYITVNSDDKLVVSHASLFDWLEDGTLSGDYWVDQKHGTKRFFSFANTREAVNSTFMLANFDKYLKTNSIEEEKFFDDSTKANDWLMAGSLKHIDMSNLIELSLIYMAKGGNCNSQYVINMIDYISKHINVLYSNPMINDLGYYLKYIDKKLDFNSNIEIGIVQKLLKSILDIFYLESICMINELTSHVLSYGYYAIYLYKILLHNSKNTTIIHDEAVSLFQVFASLSTRQCYYKMCMNDERLNNLLKDLLIFDKEHKTSISAECSQIINL